MTLSQTIYARHHGNMLFWRLGRLGGSIYMAASAIPESEGAKAERKAMKRARKSELRARARSADAWRRIALSTY